MKKFYAALTALSLVLAVTLWWYPNTTRAATSYVDSTTNEAASGTALTVTKPTGTTAGDIVIVFISINGGAGDGMTSLTDNNGSTPFTDAGAGLRHYNSDSGTYQIFYRVAGASEPASYAFTSNLNTRWSIYASTYRGGDTSTPFDVAPTTTSENIGTVTTVATDAITTLTDNAMIIAVAADDSGSVTFSATPSGFNSRENNPGNQLGALADLLRVSAGTQASVSWTASGANGWATQIFSLKADAGAAASAPIIQGTSFWW